MRYWTWLVVSIRRWLWARASARSEVQIDGFGPGAHHGDDGQPAVWLEDIARYGDGDRPMFHGGTLGEEMRAAPPGQIPNPPGAPVPTPAMLPAIDACAQTASRTRTTAPSQAETSGRDPPLRHDRAPLRVVPVRQRSAPVDLPGLRAPILPRIIVATHTPSVGTAPVDRPEPVHHPRGTGSGYATGIGRVAPAPDAPARPVTDARTARISADRPDNEAKSYARASPTRPLDNGAESDWPSDYGWSGSAPAIGSEFGPVPSSAQPAFLAPDWTATAPRKPDVQPLAPATATPERPSTGWTLPAADRANWSRTPASGTGRTVTALRVRAGVEEGDIDFPAFPVTLAETGRLEVGESLRRRLDAAARSLVWRD